MIKTEVNIESLRERTADDNELAMELLELLGENKTEYESEIHDSLAENDLVKLASCLHKFKSAVAVLGFDNLAGEIASVEKKALKNSTEINYSLKINRIFISLNNHIVELEKILKK